MKNLIIFSLGLLFLFSCGNKKKSAEIDVQQAESQTIELSTAQIKNAGIVVAPLQQKKISSILKLNGKIDVPPQNIVSISVPLGGYLKSTQLLPGMHIRKGEVIAIVEDQQYIQLQQDYLTAKSKISFLENEYNRQKELNESKASSDKAFQQAETEFKSQRVLISALAEKLKLVGINLSRLDENTITRSIQIHSPIDGYVSRVNVNIGKYVAPTEVLFELINPTDIHLALKVFEKDVSKLFIGQKLTAFTNNEPQKKYACEILLIGRDLSMDRNTEVHCHFELYDKTLIPGTYMNAEVEVQSKETHVLPAEAVVRFENKSFVFIQRNVGQYEMIEIETGIVDGGFVEVLFSNEQMKQQSFVHKGAYSLLMSLKNKAED